MPLFEMPKPKVVQTIKQEPKTQNTQNLTVYNECFALCGAGKGKIIYISNVPKRPTLIHSLYATLSNDVEGLVFFAINKALDFLKYYSKKVVIYSGYTYEDIEQFSRIVQHSNMDRYQCKMILDKVKDFEQVTFKKVCPYPEANELLTKVKEGIAK